MSDDLGRGQLGWSAERWQALDILAADAVTATVVLRNLVEHQEVTGARSVRIASKNVDVITIRSSEFDFDMSEEEEADLDRKVQAYGQNLAVEEDRKLIEVMAPIPIKEKVGYGAFATARRVLGEKGVHSGFGAVASPAAATALDVEIAGTKSGRDIVQDTVLNTRVAQSNALTGTEVHALVLRATPPAYRLVHVTGPQLRVIGVKGGKTIVLVIEESIAVGALEDGRCVGIVSVAR